MANNQNLKPFVKGYDPRRNMKSVPKETTLIREKMRKIAAEIIGEGTEAEMSRFEAMLRQLWTSRNPAHNKLALQVLDPKILTEHIEQNGEQNIQLIVKYADPNDKPTEATPKAD